MVVPENPNNQPEALDPKAAETTRNLQDAVVQGSPVKFDKINTNLNDRDTDALLGSLTFNDGKASTSDISKPGSDPIVSAALERNAEIAKMTTTDECEAGLSMERSTVANLESRINGTINAKDLAEDKQQADKLLEANTYFANFA